MCDKMCRKDDESYIETGADTGIYSGGCEILKRENYTKKGKKGDLSIKTIFLK